MTVVPASLRSTSTVPLSGRARSSNASALSRRRSRWPSSIDRQLARPPSRHVDDLTEMRSAGAPTAWSSASRISW